MSKITIVFVHWTLNVGGTEKQFVEMVRRLDSKLFDPRVLVIRQCGKLRSELEALGIPLRVLNFSAPGGRVHYGSYVRFLRLLYQMVRYFRQEQPHIVQSYLNWANLCATMTAKMARVPIIITGRRAILDEKYLHFPQFPDQWLRNFSNIWVTAVIANSDNVRQCCLQQEKFLSAEKIRVVHNGVDLETFAPTRMSLPIKEFFRIPAKCQVVGMIATLRPRKGHCILLEAAVRILQEMPDTVFLLVGRDNGIQKELEAFAEKCGIRESIVFSGERHDIPVILSIIDILVSSSFYEGLSNALLEGMATGKPIVATDIAGNPEIVVHGQTGFLVPPGKPEAFADAVIRLLQDTVLQEQMGKAGRSRAQQFFGMAQMIHKTEQVYKDLVSARTIIS